jgi:hypothetical protein
LPSKRRPGRVKAGHSTSTGHAACVVRIATGDVERALPPRDGVFLKKRFRENLGLAVA